MTLVRVYCGPIACGPGLSRCWSRDPVGGQATRRGFTGQGDGGSSERRSRPRHWFLDRFILILLLLLADNLSFNEIGVDALCPLSFSNRQNGLFCPRKETAQTDCPEQIFC